MQVGAPLDRFGMALSFLCAAHCLAAPLLFALIPSLVLGLHSFNSPARPWALALIGLQAYEALIVAVAVSVALLSLVSGWRRHRRWLALPWAAGAMIAFALGLTTPPHSMLLHGGLLALGGFLLVIAHAVNLRERRRSARTAHLGSSVP